MLAGLEVFSPFSSFSCLLVSGINLVVMAVALVVAAAVMVAAVLVSQRFYGCLPTSLSCIVFFPILPSCSPSHLQLCSHKGSGHPSPSPRGLRLCLL